MLEKLAFGPLMPPKSRSARLPRPQKEQPAGELRATQVNLAGLLSVLAENLYSTPVVALRELVQNAHDSCVRRTLEAKDGAASSIRVWARPGMVHVEDTGAGLTHDEMVAYLATIGSSYTRRLREQSGDESLIGCFGLGFLSAFVVADKVTVHSSSYQQPGEAWVYQSRDGQAYTLRPGEACAVGTRVDIDLKDRFSMLSSDGFLREALEHFCALLRIPVHVGAAGAVINDEVPPWRLDERDDHPVKRRKRRLAFARRWERTFEPLATMDLQPGTGSDVRGMLWIQDGMSYGSSDNRNVSVYVRGMLVDADARDLLPTWAGFVGGVIESDRLTPTASREALKKDHAFKEAAELIESSLVSGLVAVARGEAETWRRVLARHNEALLGASLCDDQLFEALADHLRVPTTEGDLGAAALRDRSADRRIHVSLDTADGFEEMLCRALGVPMALGYRYGALPFLERWCQSRRAELVRLGTGEGNRRVFERAVLPEEKHRTLAELLGVTVAGLVPARFAPTELPFLVVPNRDAELRERLESDEADARIGTAALGLARLFSATLDAGARRQLFLNVDSPLVKRLLDAQGARARDVARLLRALVVLQTRSAGLTEGTSFREALATVNEVLGAWIDQG